MKKLNKFQFISLVISILIVAFIFTNSACPAEESGDMSGGLLGFINGVIAFFGIDWQMPHNLLRKIAHFVEFFGLGVSFLVTTVAFTKKIVLHLTKPLFFSMAVAVIDEMIQSFFPGRSSQVSDVLLDFFGAFCGVMTALLVVYIINKRGGRYVIQKHNCTKGNI